MVRRKDRHDCIWGPTPNLDGTKPDAGCGVSTPRFYDKILARDIWKQFSHRRLHLTACRDENALTRNEESETLNRTHQRGRTPTWDTHCFGRDRRERGQNESPCRQPALNRKDYRSKQVSLQVL